MAATAIAMTAMDSAEAISEKSLIRRSSKLVETIDKIQASEHSSIPLAIIEQAKDVIILRQYEAGLVFGGKGGYGLVFTRQEDGGWGSPAWIKTGEGSWGLQIGVQHLSVVLLLMNDDSLKLLDRPKFQIGVDAGATAGPVGRNVAARFGNDSPILIYQETDGFYAGASLEGGFLIPARSANEISYQSEFTVPEILEGKAGSTPYLLKPVLNRLKSIQKKAENTEN